MLATVRDAALFEKIRRAGLQRHVWQWQSFAAFCQYRRVHEAGGNARGSILELERVLKPGGHFLCFHLPNRYAWGENLRKVLKRLGAAEEFHPVLYTNRTFGDLLRATTFEVVEAWRYGWLPRNRLSRLPAVMSEASAGVAIINGIDAGLERVLAPFSQNWAFVLVKRPAETER